MIESSEADAHIQGPPVFDLGGTATFWFIF